MKLALGISRISLSLSVYQCAFVIKITGRCTDILSGCCNENKYSIGPSKQRWPQLSLSQIQLADILLHFIYLSIHLFFPYLSVLFLIYLFLYSLNYLICLLMISVVIHLLIYFLIYWKEHQTILLSLKLV